MPAISSRLLCICKCHSLVPFRPRVAKDENILTNDYFYSSTGITSRGRVGIDAALRARPLVNPWFADPTDKTVLVKALKDVISTMDQGPF